MNVDMGHDTGSDDHGICQHW